MTKEFIIWLLLRLAELEVKDLMKYMSELKPAVKAKLETQLKDLSTLIDQGDK